VTTEQPRLVGREAAVSRLSGWVDDLAAGLGRAVLIEGEPGIGKSALLSVAANLAAARDTAVFRGAGEELARAFPLLPLLDAFAVRELAAPTDPADPADPARSQRAHLLQALRGRHADAAIAAAEAVLALVDHLCSQSPAVLIMDDLHWADEPTISVCQQLAQTAGQRPLLFIGAMRPESRRADLAALRGAVGPAGLIELGPLPPAAVTDLVADLAGGRPGPALAQLALDAAGNPLYLGELVDALDRGGGLRVAAGTAEVAGGPVPATLSAAIADRLDFLPRPARDLLQAGSLLGSDFTVAELAIVAGGDPRDLAVALADAQAAGVLVDTGDRLAFRHPLIRTALYNDMSATIRTAWHRDAARALYDAGSSPDRVARQLFPAVSGRGQDAVMDPLEPADWVIDWLVDASPTLLNQVPPVAVELLETAVRRLPAGNSRHLLLTSRLADGLLRLGRTAQAAQLAERTLHEDIDPDLSTALHLTLARCRFITGDYAAGLAGLEDALARPDLSDRQRALILVRLARLGTYAGQQEAAEHAARDALSWAGGHGDAGIAATALVSLAANRAWRGDERGALELCNQAVALVDGHPDLGDIRLQAQLYAGSQLTVLDQIEEAEATLRQVQQLADRIGDRARAEDAQGMLAALFYETGRWDDALTETESAAEIPSPYPAGLVAGVAALIALHRGETAPAASMPADDDVVIGFRWLAWALELERAGAVRPALAMLSVAEGDAQEIEVWLADATRLAVVAGDMDAAGDLVARAEALLSRGEIPHRVGTAMYCRGLVAADPSGLLRAAEHYAAGHRPLGRAQALEAAAMLLAEHGDLAAARQPFGTAIDIYGGLDAAADIARMRARFRPYGLRQFTPRPRRPTTGWASLTSAEAQVAELAAAGLSNPEIAERLAVSRRTVATHVGHVLAKLQLRSRVDLARAAAGRSQAAQGRSV